MLKAHVTLVLASALCCAQQAFEMRGTVIEPSTKHLLEGVEVSIIPGNGLLLPDTKVTKILTDSQGAFRYQPAEPGQYVVRVRKDGYTRLTSRGSVSDQSSAMISAEKPTAEFHFSLQRAGVITGRVIDDETEAPLANLRVGISTYASTDGHAAAGGTTVNTDAQGHFQSTTTAGDYLIEIRPQVGGPNHIVTRFSADDIKATDLGYRRSFFPNGPEVEFALPLNVPSGGEADFGTIRVRKQPLSRVYVDVNAASCPPGEQLNVSESFIRYRASENYPSIPIPCGPFLLTHMTPGTYELQLRAGKAPDSVEARVRYSVTGQNLELPLTLGHGFAIPGRVAAEGAGDLPLTTFKVSFGPIGTFVPMAEVQPHAVDAEGRFKFTNIFPARRKVQIAGLGTQYFIKELRYRGLPAPGNIFDFTGDGGLEIEIDKSPAVLTGSVTNSDKPVPGADVVFLRWPVGADDDRDAIRHIAADADGRFQITAIVPGEYRIFAVTADDRDEAERAAPWQRLLTRAQKLTLARGASQNVVLTVSDPSR